MTFTPTIATVNQRAQIGAETTPGTGVPANKYLECFDYIKSFLLLLNYY